MDFRPATRKNPYYDCSFIAYVVLSPIMEDKQSKKSLTITISTLSMLPIMAAATVAPILGEFQKVFPDSSDLMIRMILTLPQIMIIPVSLITGKLSSRFRKKDLLIIGLTLYIIGGLTGGFIPNIMALLSCRALLGVGIGMIYPLTTSLVADFFEGEQRVHMMGISSALNNLGGVIATLLSGSLAILSWRAPFLLYCIAILVLIETIIFLPKENKVFSSQKSSVNDGLLSTLPFLFGIILLNIIFYTTPSTTSMSIRELALGSSLFSGLMLATQNFCSFLTSSTFKKTFSIFGKMIRYVGMFLITSGYLLFLSVQTRWTLAISMILIGSGYGFLTPYYLVEISNSVSEKSRTFALSLASSSIFLGQFCNPIILTALQKSLQIKMPVAVSLLLILPFTLLMIFSDLKRSKR